MHKLKISEILENDCSPYSLPYLGYAIAALHYIKHFFFVILFKISLSQNGDQC